MRKPLITRRLMMGGAIAALGAAGARAASDPIEIEWTDLMPGDGGVLYDTIRDLGVVEHGQMLGFFDQETAAAVTTDYNGSIVRIPGYVVPLDFGEDGTREFLLVPYIGACIHVPPPPPNQIIFVTTETPYQTSAYFDAVFVTGMFSTMAVSTELAEIGYMLRADEIEPYD